MTNSQPILQKGSPVPDDLAKEAAQPIGHLAIRGIIWTMGQTVGTKCITIIQQMLIARLFLDDEDFGLLAIAQVVISFASLGQSLGVGEILVRRHRHFGKWVDAGFWLNLTGGIAGMLLVLGILPVWESLFLHTSRLFGGHLQQAPEIKGILAIWALWLPLDAMTTVMNARLRVDMRFRMIAVLQTLQTLLLAGAGLGLACARMGAYSLVIPIPIMAAGLLAGQWIATRQRIRPRLELRRWKLLLRDARFLWLGSIFNVLLQQGDYMVSGMFFSRALLGTYYFAYRMSTQTAQLIGANLASVLVPSLAKLDHDDTRQIQAYEKTCAIVLLAGTPICFLQSLLGGPLFHIVFGPKWNGAIPMFQFLSIGMGISLPMTSAASLLTAQGRYRFNTVMAAVISLLFVGFALTGAMFGSVIYVSLFVALHLSVLGPITTVLPVLRNKVAPLPFLWRIYAFPVGAGGISVLAGWALSEVLGSGDWGALLIRTAGFLAVFITALALLRPRAAKETGERLATFLQRRPRRMGISG